MSKNGRVQSASSIVEGTLNLSSINYTIEFKLSVLSFWDECKMLIKKTFLKIYKILFIFLIVSYKMNEASCYN